MAADGGQQPDTTQVRRGRKFDQVLTGAREVFLAHGYEGASVDDIARAAGVSKATLYSYFPDKRHLFAEMASVECCRQADMALNDIDMSLPPEPVLTECGQRLNTFIMSDIGQSIFRICVAESERFPDIGQQFYDSGPLIVRNAMIEYLKASAERGEVVISNFEIAAEQFLELCKANIWLRRTFNVDKVISSEEIDVVVAEAVATWLARYGA